MNLIPAEPPEIETGAVAASRIATLSPAKPAPPSPVGQRALMIVVLLAAAFVLGSGLWLLLQQLVPQMTAPASPESAYVASFPERSIAVLPFADVDGATHDLLVADAAQDAIIHALSKVADLRVISRTSVMNYPPSQTRYLRTIAENLGAGHILEGRVHRHEEKVLLTLELSDARRGAKLWTMSYECAPSDIFGVQADLVRRIARQLQAKISLAEEAAIAERPTRDLAAYRPYVHGKTLVAGIANGQIQEKLLQAVQDLNLATQLDPNFYLAYCQLAAAHDYLYFFGFDHTPARRALAEVALQNAIRLQPEAGETHLAKANFLYRCHLDYEAARAELRVAERLLPNNSEAFELAGYINRRQGFWTESSRSLQRAIKLDPQNVFLLQQMAASYQENRQFRSMAAALDNALAIAPHDLDSRVTRAVVDLEWRADPKPLRRLIETLLTEEPASAPDLADQWFYLSLCERDPAAVDRALAAIPPTGISTDVNFPRAYCEALAARTRGDNAAAQRAFLAAREEVENTIRIQHDYGPAHIALGLIDAGLGRKEEAIREGRRALELLPVSKDSIDGAELMKYLGVIYLWCGEKDLALAQIAATLRVPSTLSYGNLKLHPYWDGLRGDPRFEKIVAGLAPRD